MGLFSNIFKSTSSEFSYNPKTESEAFMGILFACMAADGDVSDVEIDRMSQILMFKQFIDSKKIIEHYKTAHMAHKKVGSQAMIDSSVSQISEGRKAVLFALVMETVLSDGILDKNEQEIAEYLSKALALDDQLA